MSQDDILSSLVIAAKSFTRLATGSRPIAESTAHPSVDTTAVNALTSPLLNASLAARSLAMMVFSACASWARTSPVPAQSNAPAMTIPVTLMVWLLFGRDIPPATLLPLFDPELVELLAHHLAGGRRRGILVDREDLPVAADVEGPSGSELLVRRTIEADDAVRLRRLLGRV